MAVVSVGLVIREALNRWDRAQGRCFGIEPFAGVFIVHRYAKGDLRPLGFRGRCGGLLPRIRKASGPCPALRLIGLIKLPPLLSPHHAGPKPAAL